MPGRLLLRLLFLLAAAGPAAPLPLFLRPPCPAVCERERCPPRSPQACSALGGELQPDRCGCCWECAFGEGQPCAPGGGCVSGLVCDGGICSCPAESSSSGAVCGSDGRTYRGLCQLRVENRHGRLRDQPPVIAVQKGSCGETGKGSRN